MNCQIKIFCVRQNKIRPRGMLSFVDVVTRKFDWTELASKAEAARAARRRRRSPDCVLRTKKDPPSWFFSPRAKPRKVFRLNMVQNLPPRLPKALESSRGDSRQDPEQTGSVWMVSEPTLSLFVGGSQVSAAR